jgi:trk system potassium uptake protein TrkA
MALAGFGVTEIEARRAIILGGGNIGQGLAQQIKDHYPDTWITIIERDPAQAELAAKALPKCVVLAGDVLAPEILHEAGVSKAEVVISVTNVDETNLLSALLAKRYGASRTMALLNSSNYSALTAPLGIDVVINPRAITVSNILQRIRRGRIHAIHSLQEGLGEVIEADAMETSGLVGKPLRDVELPDGIQIGAVVRGQKVISPRGSTVIAVGDRVVLFASSNAIKKAEKLFSVRLEYF